MPAWKDRISESDLDALVAYLFSLADQLPQTAAVDESQPAAANGPQPAASAAN
jgi:mono/diheme cytochrome c family protein